LSAIHEKAYDVDLTVRRSPDGVLGTHSR